MAKSIRSKRGKKMRAIKRVRYTEKQVKQLKETVAMNVQHASQGSLSMDAVRAEVVDYLEFKKKQVAEKLQKKSEEGAMETNEVSTFSTKTMKDQNGNYPKWMGQKQVRKQKHKCDKKRKSNGRRKEW